MKIASTQYSLNTQSFEIYLSGCDGHCDGCHNPELQDYNLGNDYWNVLPNIISKINEFDSMIKWVWVLGGEPLLQVDNRLIDLLKTIRQKTNKPIMLWTRFDMIDIPQRIKECCDYIKTGEYREDLITDDNIKYGIKLASLNQAIYKMEELNERN